MQKYDWLHNAQVSFSTGTSGNSEIPNFDHLALASGGWIYMDAAGIAPQQKGNEKLSWETTWTTNLGFHLGFFERFNVDLELYHKRTSDMLMEVPQSYSEGNNGFRWDNIGVMTNMGVELAINADVLRLRDFVWNLSANVSYNKNEIKELYNGVQEYELPNTSTKNGGWSSAGRILHQPAMPVLILQTADPLCGMTKRVILPPNSENRTR